MMGPVIAQSHASQNREKGITVNKAQLHIRDPYVKSPTQGEKKYTAPRRAWLYLSGTQTVEN